MQSRAGARQDATQRRGVDAPAVVCCGDAECLTNTPGPGTQHARIVEAAACTHGLEPDERLDRTDQHGRPVPGGTTDDVEAPMEAVRPVHQLHVARPSEHRDVPERRAGVAVDAGSSRS